MIIPIQFYIKYKGEGLTFEYWRFGTIPTNYTCKRKLEGVFGSYTEVLNYEYYLGWF